MYINLESVEIETIDGKKSKQTVVEETGEQAANTWAAGHVLRKETKVRTALAWQSLNKVNNIWKSDFAEKKAEVIQTN